MTTDDNMFAHTPNNSPTHAPGSGAHLQRKGEQHDEDAMDALDDSDVGDVMDGEGEVDALALFALLEQVGAGERERRVADLLAGLASARALGGQPLADAVLRGVTDERHETLMDQLLATASGQPGAALAAPVDDASTLPAASATDGRHPAATLSEGAQRAITRIFGEMDADEGAYAQRTPSPLARVAEARAAYQLDEDGVTKDVQDTDIQGG